jgi:hypothetical protein
MGRGGWKELQGGGGIAIGEKGRREEKRIIDTERGEVSDSGIELTL